MFKKFICIFCLSIIPLQALEYVHYSRLLSEQSWYSAANVSCEVTNIKKRGDALWDGEKWVFRYHNGTSVLSESDTLNVVQTTNGYIVREDPCIVLSSLEVGAEWFPITVVEMENVGETTQEYSFFDLKAER